MSPNPPQISDSRWLIYPPEPLEQTIRGALLNALAYTSGNQSAAAKALGISKSMMTYHMRVHDIPTNRPRKQPRTIMPGLES